MATEELIVLLDARTAKLDAKLNSTNAKLDELGRATDQADTKLNKFSASAKKAGTAVGVATVAVAAAAVGTNALIRQTTAYAKEIRIASQLSGIAAKELQAMGLATSTVGIGIEKLGDISKDTREKIGDFLNTGGGGFKDFVDAMKMTKEEAKLVADEFAVLSGPDILQEMVTRMEEAGVSAVQMSHALEGMASDTTNLIPLLLDGGKGMRDLRDAMEGVTVPLTEEDIKKLADLELAMNLAAESAKSLANQVLVDLSDWFINAANSAAIFFGSLNEGSKADLESKLAPVLEDIEEIEEKLKRAGGGEEVRLKGMLDKLIAQKAELTTALKELEVKTVQPEFKKTETDNTPSGGALTPDEIAKRKQAIIDSFKSEQELLAEKYKSDQELFAGNKEVLFQLEAQYKEKLAELNSDDSLDSIRDRYKSEETLLQEKFERELEQIGENDELKKQRQAQYIEDMIELDKKRTDETEKEQAKRDAAFIKNTEDKKKVEQQIESKNIKSLMQITGAMVGHSSAIGKALFLVNQGVALSDAFVNTQAASVKALTIDPTGILSAKVQMAGNLSMAAIAAATIGGISGGGGGGSGGVMSGGGSSSSSAPQQQQDNFVPDSTSLAITESTASGSTQGRISFSDDSGDDILDAIARGLNKGQSEGRFS
jgi:hypothetical protein